MDKSTKFFLSVALGCVVLLGGGVALVIDAFTHVPDFREMRTKVTVPIKLSNESWTTREMGPKTPQWASVGQISNHVLMAVIASEDTSFFSHKGVDYHELQEAIKKDWEEKRWARGASTLTQQVVKNVYLGRQKTLWRKFKEFVWAREIEKVLTKTEILCFYLNMVEWGPDIYGIRVAAQHYFEVSPALLTAKQSAFLAMLLPSPIKYHAYYKKKALTPWAKGRLGQILKVMNRMGFIDDSTYQEALREKLWGLTGELGPTKEENDYLPKEEPEAVDVLKEPIQGMQPSKSEIKSTVPDVLQEPPAVSVPSFDGSGQEAPNLEPEKPNAEVPQDNALQDNLIAEPPNSETKDAPSTSTETPGAIKED